MATETENKSLKTRILAAIVLLAVLGGTYFAVATLENNEFFLDPVQAGGQTYVLEEPDFELDIFTIPEYNSLIEDEFIKYSDGATTVSVFPDSYNSYSAAAQLVFLFVHAIQAGDTDAYNACLSERFIEAAGKQSAFTMQQIYDVLIVESPAIREGIYLRTDIELSYKIRENNGTLRADMGSDAVKKQVLIIRETDIEKPKIDAVNTEYILDRPQDLRTYNETNIALVAVIAGSLNAAAVIGTIIVFIKTKRKISDAE